MIRPPLVIKRRSGRCSRFRCIVALIVVLALFMPFAYISKIRRRRILESTSGNSESLPVQINPQRLPEGKPVHFIYTIGCGGSSDTSWQLLQSTALDSSFLRVKQRGKITRLVSGCVNDFKRQEYISRSVIPYLQTYFVQSADQVDVTSKTRDTRTYVQANRPTALQEYLRVMEAKGEDVTTVYIVLDPDFIFRKQYPEDAIEAVKDGTLVSHRYSLMDPASFAYPACMEAFNATLICDRIQYTKSFRSYHAGVPYMLTRNDWLKLLSYWIPLIGPVLLRYPGIESDMISWAIAAALAGLKSDLRSNFMATCMSSERSSVEVLNHQVFLHLCQSYYIPETRSGDQYKVNNVAELPHIVQRKSWLRDVDYVFVFNKHWLKASNLLEDCAVPLLVLPPTVLPEPRVAQDSHFFWFQAILSEALDAYNRAIVDYRENILKCPKQSLGGDVKRGLILHERISKRFGGGWNHAIDL